MEKIKVAFLDRDGTISKEYDEKGWIKRTEPELLEGTIEALKILRKNNYEIIIITNQGLINQGIIKENEYELFTKNLLEELKINGIDVLDIFMCPHTEKENCNCRKPKPGMILSALKKYNIDMDKSFMAGDTFRDEGIAEYFKLLFFGVNYKPKILYNLKYLK